MNEIFSIFPSDPPRPSATVDIGGTDSRTANETECDSMGISTLLQEILGSGVHMEFHPEQQDEQPPMIFHSPVPFSPSAHEDEHTIASGFHNYQHKDLTPLIDHGSDSGALLSRNSSENGPQLRSVGKDYLHEITTKVGGTDRAVPAVLRHTKGGAMGAAQKRKRAPRQRAPTGGDAGTPSLDAKLRNIFSEDDFVASIPVWKLRLKQARLPEAEAQRAQQMRRRALSRGYTSKSRQKDVRKQQTIQQQLVTAEQKVVQMQKEIAQLRKENALLLRTRTSPTAFLFDERFDSWSSTVPSPNDSSSSEHVSLLSDDERFDSWLSSVPSPNDI